jgi:hypothetical protein
VTTGKSTTLTRLGLLLVASVTASFAASQAASASEQRSRPPKVIQLSYAQWYEEPGGSLAAFARRPDSLTFTTRYRGRQASVPAKQTGLFDTNLPRCCNQGWEPIRHQGAARVYRLIRKALNRRGVAKVRTRAKRDRHVEDQRWRIVLAQCSQDPPSYPVTCEIAPNGEHY